MVFKTLGKSGLKVSICGFGGYRVDYNDDNQRNALRYALEKGINLIDTSSNYTDGNSEFLVGQVITEFIKDEKLKREDLVVVTKGGYIQGINYDTAHRLELSGKLYPDVVKCSEGLWHCIHPDFLDVQINLSLGRLNLDFIDVYLLHNPEYYLRYTEGDNLEEKQAEYYARIKKAFLYLEGAVQEGKIKYYGVSSNTFGEMSDISDFTSLERLIEIANEISPDNHFSVIQCPLNLTESGAVLNLNQAGNTKSVLQVAQENNIGVLINRPLNRIKDKRIDRLVWYNVPEFNNEEFEYALLHFDVSEEEIRINVDYLPITNDEKVKIKQALTVHEFVVKNLSSFYDPVQWKDLVERRIMPYVEFFVEKLPEMDRGDVRNLKPLLETYKDRFIDLSKLMHIKLAEQTNARNVQISSVLNNYLEKELHSLSLSAKSILMLNSLPSVTSTLVGMRQNEYVDDVLTSVEAEFASRAEEFWHMERI